MRAKDLRRNAKNWRVHPDRQRSALNGILRTIGYADAVIARETRGGPLELIDGHMRVDEADPDQKLPVLVLDVTAKEADKLLATLDPISAMAEVDKDELQSLLDCFDTGDDDVDQLVQFVAKKNRLNLNTDADDEESEPERCPECGQAIRSADKPTAGKSRTNKKARRKSSSRRR